MHNTTSTSAFILYPPEPSNLTFSYFSDEQRKR